MKVIVLYDDGNPGMTMAVHAVDGDQEAILAYGNKLVAEAGDDNWEFVVTEVHIPAVQCFMAERLS